MVKVVEGQQAVLMNTAANGDVATNDDAVPSNGAAEIYSDNNASGKAKKLSGADSSMSLSYTLGAAILLGGTAIVIRRLKVAGR